MISEKWTLAVLAVIGICGIASVIKNRPIVTSPDKMARSFFLLGFIEVGISFLQLIGVFPSCNPFYRLTGTFDNPTLLGMQMCLCLPIGIYHIIKSQGRWRMIWLLLSVAVALCMVLTASRTSVIAGIISSLALSLIEVPSIIKKQIRGKWLAIFVPAIFAFATILYFFKQDSVDGRMLIWIVSIDMIKDSFLCGWGRNGFDSHYMFYQASYFLHHPDSKYLYLADNVFHPFNEILQFVISYGFGGTFVVLCLVMILLKYTKYDKNEYSGIFFSLLVSIGILSMFSYPSKVYFIWLVGGFLLSSLFYLRQSSPLLKAFSLSCSASFILIFLQGVSAFRSEWKWMQLQMNYSNRDRTEVMGQYSALYEELRESSSFLYNYGAVLHLFGQYRKSLDVLNECSKLYNDYNVQMLIADNLKQIGYKDEAIEVLKFANAMIPNRFLPLYYEMETYLECGDTINAYNTAFRIINKPAKVAGSPTVKKIKEEAQKMIHIYSDMRNCPQRRRQILYNDGFATEKPGRT